LVVKTVIWMIMAPVPVDLLLPATQLPERAFLMVLRLIVLISPHFVVTPSVIILVIIYLELDF